MYARYSVAAEVLLLRQICLSVKQLACWRYVADMMSTPIHLTAGTKMNLSWGYLSYNTHLVPSLFNITHINYHSDLNDLGDILISWLNE